MTHTDCSYSWMVSSTHSWDDETDKKESKDDAAYYQFLHHQHSRRLAVAVVEW